MVESSDKPRVTEGPHGSRRSQSSDRHENHSAPFDHGHADEGTAKDNETAEGTSKRKHRIKLWDSFLSKTRRIRTKRKRSQLEKRASSQPNIPMSSASASNLNQDPAGHVRNSHLVTNGTNQPMEDGFDYPNGNDTGASNRKHRSYRRQHSGSETASRSSRTTPPGKRNSSSSRGGSVEQVDSNIGTGIRTERDVIGVNNRDSSRDQSQRKIMSSPSRTISSRTSLEAGGIWTSGESAPAPGIGHGMRSRTASDPNMSKFGGDEDIEDKSLDDDGGGSRDGLMDGTPDRHGSEDGFHDAEAVILVVEHTEVSLGVLCFCVF